MTSTTKDLPPSTPHPESVRHPSRRWGFLHQSREKQVQLLLDWLHPDLRDLPGITWENVPGSVICYFVRTVKKAPHAPHLALVVGNAQKGTAVETLRGMVSRLHCLFSFLQKHCNVGDDFQLTREVWERYVSLTPKKASRRETLVAYSAATEVHLAEFVEQLDTVTRLKLAPYLLPRLPARFLEQYGGSREIFLTQQKRRKEKSDILVPLHSILVALIQFRKQEAQRLLLAFHEAVRRADAGEALPFEFSYNETLVEASPDAQTVAEFRLEKKPVLLTFKLWNRQAWTLHHPDDFSRTVRQSAEKGINSYKPETERYFVEYLGDPAQLLWFGDIIQNGLVRHFSATLSRKNKLSEKDLQRRSLAQSFGASHGFATERANLLAPSGGFAIWLARYVYPRFHVMVFEPESLYRGVLYASALATLVLTNGSRLSELLQVSADRFKGHVYEAQKSGEESQHVIWLQHLLPKGRKTEAERQLFPICPQAYELLREIGSLLKEAYGDIPAVSPHPANKKAEDLLPERYLFQWAASPDGREGTLAPRDVPTLLRFILHGLEFRTKQGERFTVSTHLLRHVMATVARHEYEVPAEVVAFVLHHQQSDLPVPMATEYYSRMPEEQQLKILAEFLIELEEQAANVLLNVPKERTLEQMDEDLRDVFERWQTLLETAFGFCGCTGLCPRGYHRSLCLGCPHLIPDPRKQGSAVKWRASYARQAEELEAEGATVDARQARLQVQELEDLINSMSVLQQAIDDGTRQPVFLQLPSAPYDTVVVDAQA